MSSRIILIEPAASPKPGVGQPCNGCGVCCLYEPCPLGRLLSGQSRGPCPSLRWEGAQARYRCGAMTEPRSVLQSSLPWPLRWLTPVLTPLLRRLAGRWIAAGQGCDCHLEVRPGTSAQKSDGQSAA